MSLATRWMGYGLPIFLLAGCSAAMPKLSWKSDPPKAAPRHIEEEIQITKRKKEKPTPQMLTDFADVQAASKNFPRAEELYQRALELDRKHAPAYVGLGKMYTARKQFDKALAVLNQGLKANPKSAAIWNEIAVAHANGGNLAQGIEAMAKAVAFEPRNKLYVENLAGMHAAAGHYPKALELYSQVLAPAEARYRLAGILHAQGRTDESLHELRLALAADPQHAASQRMLTYLSQDSVKPVGYVSPSPAHELESRDQ